MRQMLTIALALIFACSGCSESDSRRPVEPTSNPVTTERKESQPDLSTSKLQQEGGALQGAPSRRRTRETSTAENEPTLRGSASNDEPLPPELEAAAGGRKVVTIEKDGQIIDQTEDGVVLRIREK